MPESIDRGRGRPRDSEKDEAIRAAVWEVLARRGYGGLTFEEVAETAGCSRSTLYRRYTSKLELIAAVFDQTSRSIETGIPAGLSPRDLLLAHMAGTVTYMSGGRGPALLSLTAATIRIPELEAVTEAFKQQERAQWRLMFRALVPNASEQRMAFVFDTHVGIMLQHVVICRTALERRDLEMIAEMLIAMLKRPE
jgi:AcrR family transcriptional regulator